MLWYLGHDVAELFPPPLHSPPEIPSAISGLVSPYASGVQLRDVELFRAGNLHHFVDRWAQVVSRTPHGEKVGRWAFEGVCASDFFQPLRGTFMCKKFDAPMPPRAYFRNHALALELEAFVDGRMA